MAAAPLDRLALPRYLEIELDLYTLLLTVGALGAAGVLAGTVPAWLARRVMPADVLRQGGRGPLGGGGDRRWAAALITAETSLTLVLLVAGFLLLHSYTRLATIDVGFDRERIARLAITLSPSDYGSRDRLPALYDRIRRELASVPGVQRVGLVYPTLPPWDGSRIRIRPEGIDLPHAPDGVHAGVHVVDSGLLPLLGAQIVAGRGIDDRGAAAGTGIVVSRSVAAMFGGPERAVGRSLTLLGRDTTLPSGTLVIAGVAEDVAYDGLVEQEMRGFVPHDGGRVRDRRYDVYAPLAGMPSPLISVGVWTPADPAALIGPLRERLARMAPASAVHWVSTMSEEVALEYQSARFYALIVGVFSASALALTSVGLFALLAHAAARRAGEMGLRVALGASPASTGRLILKAGLMPVCAGVAIGGAAAVVVARAMSGLLFATPRFDLLAFAAAVLALLAVTLAAGLLPARRVAAIDPASALRNQ
jgi:putative ABC transport system permease protein